MSSDQLRRATRQFLMPSGANLPPADRALVDRHVPPPAHLDAPVLPPGIETDPRTRAWLDRQNDSQPRRTKP